MPYHRRGRLTPLQMKQNQLHKQVNDVLTGADLYHQWWTGPELDRTRVFAPASWGSKHNFNTKSVIFTASLARGTDTSTCSSPNDLRLFLGSARRAGIHDDIVIAVEEGQSEEAKGILRDYNVVVYEVPAKICSQYIGGVVVKEGGDNYCGSEEERVPASMFRYFFYEKWAAAYNESVLILMADFKDVIFQSNPFTFHTKEWGDYQLVLYQEFHPNMVLQRSPQHLALFRDCYGTDMLSMHGHKTVISSGTVMGTRNAVLLWAHAMTQQLTEAPGRVREDLCSSSGIDTAFANYLGYTSKLRLALRIKIYPQGEGPVNSLGGMRIPKRNKNKMGVFGPLKSFWHLLDDENWVLNWSGERSPVVHQINHFIDELRELAASNRSVYVVDQKEVDSVWQALPATRCLWGC